MKKLFGTLMVLALMLALLPATATAHTEDDPYEVPLLAGQHINVGVVKVWNDADHLYVKYVITESGWCITETHLAVATSLGGIPMTKKENPIPGRFEENDKHACVSEETYTYNLEEKGWAACDQLFIAAHAVVRKTGCKGCGSTETAWGEGQSFDGSNWGMYFEYTVQCPCTNVPEVVNGGFEAPDLPEGRAWDIYDSGTEGLGWTVEWAGTYPGAPEPAHLELHTSGTVVNAYEGSNQYAELDTDWDGPGGGLGGEPASVRIYQDLETCPGQTYTLKYAWQPRPGQDSLLAVSWDGTEPTPASSVVVNGWNVVTASVTASGLTTRLEFVETGPADSFGMFLDGVSINCDTCP